MVNSIPAQLIVKLKAIIHYHTLWNTGHIYKLNENSLKCRDHTTLLMFYMLNQERIRKERVTCVGDQSG